MRLIVLKCFFLEHFLSKLFELLRELRFCIAKFELLWNLEWPTCLGFIMLVTYKSCPLRLKATLTLWYGWFQFFNGHLLIWNPNFKQTRTVLCDWDCMSCLICFCLLVIDQEPEEWSDKESTDSSLWNDILCWYWKLVIKGLWLCHIIWCTTEEVCLRYTLYHIISCLCEWYLMNHSWVVQWIVCGSTDPNSSSNSGQDLCVVFLGKALVLAFQCLNCIWSCTIGTFFSTTTHKSIYYLLYHLCIKILVLL